MLTLGGTNGTIIRSSAPIYRSSRINANPSRNL
jgi:hypothetical protein